MGHVVPELPNVSLGSPNRSVDGVDLSDVIEPLQIFLLSSSSEQHNFSSAECSPSWVEMLVEFGDRALQPSHDPWASVDFLGRVKFHAVLTKAYKDVRIAANVETDAEVTLSSGSPENFLPQRKVPTERPVFDLSKHLRRLLRKLLLQNSAHLVLVVAVMFRDLYCFILNVAILLVLVDVYVYAPKKREKFA